MCIFRIFLIFFSFVPVRVFSVDSLPSGMNAQNLSCGAILDKKDLEASFHISTAFDNEIAMHVSGIAPVLARVDIEQIKTRAEYVGGFSNLIGIYIAVYKESQCVNVSTYLYMLSLFKGVEALIESDQEKRKTSQLIRRFIGTYKPESSCR